ncbi:MAG: hypothetical protein ACLP50_27175 [Solirubrobacteraceae bacterium]
MPCGSTAIVYGNGPAGTVAGVSGVSAPKSLSGAPNWEISLLFVSAT